MNREIAVLRQLSHPGVARLISSFRFNDGAYLVLEYAEGGDLHTMVTTNGSLDEESARFVCGEVVAGLASIHGRGFVYGDLKPEVRVCDEKETATATAVLATSKANRRGIRSASSLRSSRLYRLSLLTRLLLTSSKTLSRRRMSCSRRRGT